MRETTGRFPKWTGQEKAFCFNMKSLQGVDVIVNASTVAQVYSAEVVANDSQDDARQSLGTEN